CNQSNSYFHWLTCNNSLLIYNIIQNTIHNILQKSKLELSNFELQELEHKLANHQAFSTFQPSHNLYYIETILKKLGHLIKLLKSNFIDYLFSHQFTHFIYQPKAK
ncbi:7420_t:CDS:1, partial [Gigaspora rosea]